MADPAVLEEVRELLALHRDELVARYNAHGAGIGREGERYAIVIYLDSEGDRPVERVSLEGVPLKFEVTGPFTTLPT